MEKKFFSSSDSCSQHLILRVAVVPSASGTLRVGAITIVVVVVEVGDAMAVDAEASTTKAVVVAVVVEVLLRSLAQVRLCCRSIA